MSKQYLSRTVNRKPITWKEREAILLELSADPSNAEAVAKKFNRGITTVQKLAEKARLARVTKRDRILQSALAARSLTDRPESDRSAAARSLGFLIKPVELGVSSAIRGPKPMEASERRYIEFRAEREIRSALTAKHPNAAKAHYKLAEMYFERLYPRADHKDDAIPFAEAKDGSQGN